MELSDITCYFDIQGLLVLPFTLDKIGEEREKYIRNLPVILIPYEISTKLSSIDTFVEVRREETINKARTVLSRKRIFLGRRRKQERGKAASNHFPHFLSVNLHLQNMSSGWGSGGAKRHST